MRVLFLQSGEMAIQLFPIYLVFVGNSYDT